MNLIHIVPTTNNELIGDQPMYMFLTHLVLSDERYREYATAYSGYKILDNSLIECDGRAMDLHDVLRAAEMIGAHEIILPDVFRDGEATVKNVYESIKFIRDAGLIGKYKLMAVCQGSTSTMFEICFQELQQIPEIDVIGIPKVCAKMHPMGRPYFERLWEEWAGKEIHLLGIWYSFTELFKYRHPERIRSVDSCLAAFLARNNLMPYDIRPDGYTIDLEYTRIDYNQWIRCMPDKNDITFFSMGSKAICSRM